MSEIVIQLDGGLVQDVFLRGEGTITKAIIVDEDVEMCDPDNLLSVEIGKGKVYTASVHSNTVTPLPVDSDVDKMVATYLNK